MKATPPHSADASSDAFEPHLPEDLIPDQSSKPTRSKAAPAKKARKATRPTPAKAPATGPATGPAQLRQTPPTKLGDAAETTPVPEAAETRPADSAAETGRAPWATAPPAASGAGKPTSTPTLPSATELKPSATELKPSATELKPTATELKPTATEAKPTATEAKPTATEAKPTATTTEPPANEDESRTGAEPIPEADPAPTPHKQPAKEERTGADPIPPAEPPAQQPAEDRSVAAAPAHTPAADPVGDRAPAPAGKHVEDSRTVARRAPATPRAEPWAHLVADPGHAPELLALAAVQTLGPRASEWASRLREAYPTATDDALARLAVRQFTRFGSVGSVFAAVAGSYAPITLLGSNALTYAEIVLHVAAAYGQDPTDRQRAVDLLVLAQVHPSRDDAEAALATAEQPAYEEESGLTDAVWRLGRMVAAQATGWAVLKGVNRFFPGTSMLAAIVTSRSGARNMGAKATAYYRAGRQSQSSHSFGRSV